MGTEQLLWATIGWGFVLYALTGGADFGAGFVMLLAHGPRYTRHRELIQRALAPIWEANHVWLIFVIVLMFSAFPRAFALLSVALHIPLGCALVGIVLRGSAFVFHAYGVEDSPSQQRWQRVFASASAFTPLCLGSVLAAVSSGDIRVQGERVTSGWFAGWSGAFAALLAPFALALFTLLACAYLAAEAETAREALLARDFRNWASAAEAVAFVLAFAVFASARRYAPALFANLAHSPATWPIQGATALAALATLWLLRRERARLARYTAAAQVGCIVVGWGLAMDQHFLLPDVSLTNAGSRPEVLPALFIAVLAGSALLAPALYFLFHVFKAKR